MKAIFEFINTDSWDESQAYLEAHPELLDVDAAFDDLLALADSVDDIRILMTHRSLLGRASEIGISQAFEEFKQARRDNPDLPLIPLELIPVVRHLQNSAPARMKAYLDENPAIRDQLAALGIIEKRQNTSVESIVLAFINASTWEDKKAILKNNSKALFSAGAVIFFEEALARAENTDAMVLQAHQQLLTRCQEIGIDDAFAEAEVALRVAEDNDED